MSGRHDDPDTDAYFAGGADVSTRDELANAWLFFRTGLWVILRNGLWWGGVIAAVYAGFWLWKTYEVTAWIVGGVVAVVVVVFLLMAVCGIGADELEKRSIRAAREAQGRAPPGFSEEDLP